MKELYIIYESTLEPTYYFLTQEKMYEQLEKLVLSDLKKLKKQDIDDHWGNHVRFTNVSKVSLNEDGSIDEEEWIIDFSEDEHYYPMIEKMKEKYNLWVDNQ